MGVIHPSNRILDRPETLLDLRLGDLELSPTFRQQGRFAIGEVWIWARKASKYTLPRASPTSAAMSFMVSASPI